MADAEHECHEDMGDGPCGKPAVGVAFDYTHGGLYPVCAEHAAASAPQPEEET